MQAELSNLLAAKSQQSIDAPMDDLHRPADKSIGDPDPEPPNGARHEAAIRDPAKAKTGSAGAQSKLASLAAEHTAAAGQSSGDTISPSKPLAEAASPEALTSTNTLTYTSTDAKAAPANSPAAEGPACKDTEAGKGTIQLELPIVASNQPEVGYQSSSADSGSAWADAALKPACTDSALKPASTVRVSPAESDSSAAKLSQCGPYQAAVLIESLDETVSTKIMPNKPQCKTHDSKPQPCVKAHAARCGSGSSMSSKEQSGGPACTSNEQSNPASARLGFASTSSNVVLDVDEFMQNDFGKSPQAKSINTADP